MFCKIDWKHNKLPPHVINQVKQSCPRSQKGLCPTKFNTTGTRPVIPRTKTLLTKAASRHERERRAVWTRTRRLHYCQVPADSYGFPAPSDEADAGPPPLLTLTGPGPSRAHHHRQGRWPGCTAAGSRTGTVTVTATRRDRDSELAQLDSVDCGAEVDS